MNTLQAFRRLLTGCALFCLLISPCFGFALLGPYEDWMQVSNSFRLSQASAYEGDSRNNNTYTPGDIGGPLPTGSEYRWNVPVISYAFDRSFIEYFGAEGMREVEAAFKVLNKLPPASQIILTNHPTQVVRANYLAQSEGLYDLKSATLSLLVEQLGLAQPTRNVVVLKVIDPRFEGYYAYETQLPEWLWGDYFVRRNYDPETLTSCQFINAVRYDFAFIWPVWEGSQIGDTIEYPSDGLVGFGWGQAVADGLPTPGAYFTGLSRDDVGGLRYLLSSTNINFEAPLPDVHRLRGVRVHMEGSVATLTAAWRPGVEKITFVRHPYFPTRKRSLPLRRRYTDYFYEDGKLRGVRVERVISQPDILFTVDNGEDTPTNNFLIYPVTRTGTTNWINNALANGNVDGLGPGTISPRIKFAFRRLGNRLDTHFGTSGFTLSQNQAWGSFTTNGGSIGTYPINSYPRMHNGDMVVRQTLWDIRTWELLQAHFWKLAVPIGEAALLQNSTDQTNWMTQLTVTNDGRVTEWHCYSSNSAEVFRVIPK